MGIGRASGETRAADAANQAVHSPLLEISIDGARGILFNVIGGNDMSMHEINDAASVITAAADPNANIIFGATINPDLEGEIIVTVVATGFDPNYYNSRNSVTAKPAILPRSVGIVNGRSIAKIAQDDTTDVSDIDMTLDEHITEPLQDINNHPDTSETTKLWNDHSENVTQSPSGTTDAIAEDYLDKPSFLRKLRGK
jgi:cell division protein FtsZ